MQTEEITKAIGKSFAVRIFDVEKGAIRRFADAIDDSNPLYRDDEYAKNSYHGTVIAPPGFFGWPVKNTQGATLIITFPEELMESLVKAGYPKESLLDGGIEYDFYLPVRAGDILSAVDTLKDARERTGKSGKLCIIIIETTYLNQNGDLVAKATATYLLRAPASN
jgi:acyl dehydratase